MLNKRILIISNNALSNTNSNGRTLKNFFDVSDKDKLAQFYIQHDTPDFDACGSFFCATDGQVLKSFLKRKNAGNIIVKMDKAQENPSVQTEARKKAKRNPFTMLIRNFLWNRKKWRGTFYKWVDKFKPELVFLQAGDAPFMFDIAVSIAKKHNIPMAIYNSEDYYFKNYNYFRNSGIWGIFYPLFRGKLKKATKKAIDYASLSIYISEDLKNTYDKEFNKNSDYIYTSTEVTPCIKESNEYVFSYLGNLGLNRHIGLIKIANALNKINNNYKLNVYGKLPNDDVKNAFDACPSIDYKGLVGYGEVKEAIKSSMLVFHTESFEEFYSKDICHGFSTKIPDSLASGTCFVLFAPEHISCAKYIKEKDCAVLISDEAQLKDKLAEIIDNKDRRSYYIERAIKIAEENHSAEKNREKFACLINNL